MINSQLTITIGVKDEEPYGKQLTYTIATNNAGAPYNVTGILNKNTESEFNTALAEGIANIKNVQDFEELYNKITEGGPAITLFESLGGAIPNALQLKTMIEQYNEWKITGETKFIEGYKGFAEKAGYTPIATFPTDRLLEFCNVAISINRVTDWQNSSKDMFAEYNKFKDAMKAENDNKSNLRKNAALAGVAFIPGAAIAAAAGVVGVTGLGLYKAAQGTATGVSTGIRALKNIENAPFKLLTQAIADIEWFLTTEETKGQLWGKRLLGKKMNGFYWNAMSELQKKLQTIKNGITETYKSIPEDNIDATFTNEDWKTVKENLSKTVNPMVEGYNIFDEMQKGHMSCLRRLHTNITKTLQIDPKENKPKWNTHRPYTWDLAATFIKDILKEDRHVGGKNTRKQNNKSKQTKKSRRH